MFMKESDAHGFPLSICFVDINNLKEVNDTLGHAIGDELIVTMTDQILTHIRSTDVICRVGGDEFLIIFPTCDLPDAKHTMDRVQNALAQFNQTSQKPYTLSLSMGFAAYHPPMDRTNFVEIADNNMYDDKRLRKKMNGHPE